MTAKLFHSDELVTFTAFWKMVEDDDEEKCSSRVIIMGYLEHSNNFKQNVKSVNAKLQPKGHKASDETGTLGRIGMAHLE